jgi:hypothetical protein
MSNTLSLGRQQTKDPKTWSTLLGGSFVFFDDGSSLIFPSISPFFGYFGLFMVGRVSSYTTFYSLNFFKQYHAFFKSKLYSFLAMCSRVPPSSQFPYLPNWLFSAHILQVDYVPQQHRPPTLNMDGKWSLNRFLLPSS